MYKSKVRKITITFIIFFICLLFNNFNLAKVFNNNKEAKDLKVEISAFTNDFENTQMLKFEVEDNPNVVKGKMAPGSKAHANMKINLEGFKDSVDILVEVDKSYLYDNFEFTSKINGNNYEVGTIQNIKIDEVYKEIDLSFELEWDNYNSKLNTIIGSEKNEIEVPFVIKVMQHI